MVGEEQKRFMEHVMTIGRYIRTRFRQRNTKRIVHMNVYKIVLLLIIIVFSVVNSYHDIRDMKVYDYPSWATC